MDKFYKRMRRYTDSNKVFKIKRQHDVSVPPTTNRGAQIPTQRAEHKNVVETIHFDELCRVDYNGMLASIDWLDFTVFDMAYPFVVEKILGLSLTDFEDTGRGGGGYPNMSRANFGDIRVLHGAKNPEVMGIHVTISGSGCRALFSRVLPSTIISNIIEYGCKCTRIDLALDNIGDVYFYPREIMDFIKNRQVKSRWGKYELVQSGDMHSLSLTGDTVYLGSRTSDMFCRVYDKTLERIEKGDDKELPESWVRWELVCKRDRAQVACEQLLSSGFAIGELLFGVLSNYFSILEKPCDISDRNHVDRFALNERWLQFLGDAKPIRLFRVLQDEETLENKKEYVIKQYGPTLSALFRAYGTDAIVKEIGLNAWRMNKKLEELTIATARKLDMERAQRVQYWS